MPSPPLRYASLHGVQMNNFTFYFFSQPATITQKRYSVLACGAKWSQASVLLGFVYSKPSVNGTSIGLAQPVKLIVAHHTNASARLLLRADSCHD
jgi:hypothetical protein